MAMSRRMVGARHVGRALECRPDQRESGLNLRVASTTRLCVAAAVVLALAVAQPAFAAAVTVTAERGADSIEVRASAVLNADAATAWRVLTDYARYVDFIPDLRLSHVVERRGAIVTVEQAGNAELWLFKMPVNVTFEITESAPTGLQSRAVAGSLRALTSCYTLTPVPQGIQMDYVGRVTPGFALFGQIKLAAVEKNVARQFQALADQIERQKVGVLSHPIEGAK